MLLETVENIPFADQLWSTKSKNIGAIGKLTKNCKLDFLLLIYFPNIIQFYFNAVSAMQQMFKHSSLPSQTWTFIFTTSNDKMYIIFPNCSQLADPRKKLGLADFYTIYTIYQSLCKQTADTHFSRHTLYLK